MSGELREEPKRLHLGCGRTILPGWINLDRCPGMGVDVVADLDACATTPLPFAPDTVAEFLGSHLLEHIHDTLSLMQELHRIARPDALATFLLPYGSSDDAFEDPTHVRAYFVNSFGYFSQPYYWRADYGYRGDWKPERIILKVSKQRYRNWTPAKVFQEIQVKRNVVLEMVAELRAVKPIRLPKPEHQVAPQVQIAVV